MTDWRDIPVFRRKMAAAVQEAQRQRGLAVTPARELYAMTSGQIAVRYGPLVSRRDAKLLWREA